MKRTIAILLVAVMALTLVACSAKSKLIGTWEGDYDRITFRKDGTGTWAERSDVDRPFGEGDEFHYTVSGNKLTMEGEDPWTFTIKGNTLTFELNGNTISFTKK